MPVATALDLADWRRRVGELYAAVRADVDPPAAHARWRSGRNELFKNHPQSPLAPGDPLRERGLPYWPYDPALRFDVAVDKDPSPRQVIVATGRSTLAMERIGFVHLPAPIGGALAVWWLDEYSGGLFLPLRDGTAGETSYGGGRYVLDTAKGADLGGSGGRLVVDLNFAYHPSCRYSPAWECPLAPPENTLAAPVAAGERLEGA